MSPPGLLVDTGRCDHLAANEPDFDDLPVGKVKIPLRQQYKDLDRSAGAPSAKIDWVPSRAEYLERVARRLKQGIPHVALPDGFPQSTSPAACWSSDSINNTKLFRRLSETQIVEIEDALSHFKGWFLICD